MLAFKVRFQMSSDYVTRPENTDLSQETPVDSRPVRGPAEATVRKSRWETEGHSELDAPELRDIHQIR